MDPFILRELAIQRQEELRAAARRAHLARDARRARSDRRRVPIWSRIARWSRRRRPSDAPSAPPTTKASPRCTNPDEFASQLACDGPNALEPELRRFVDSALRRGASPLLASTLADRTEPAVVRQRAFGRLLTELTDGQGCPSYEHSEVPGAA